MADMIMNKGNGRQQNILLSVTCRFGMVELVRVSSGNQEKGILPARQNPLQKTKGHSGNNDFCKLLHTILLWDTQLWKDRKVFHSGKLWEVAGFSNLTRYSLLIIWAMKIKKQTYHSFSTELGDASTTVPGLQIVNTIKRNTSSQGRA